jgi:PUA domain protein
MFVKIYTISKNESKGVLEFINRNWPMSLGSKIKQIRVVEIDEKRKLLLFSDFKAVKFETDILPFLKDKDVLDTFPSVQVDSGAISHICNGAEVMRPGIVNWNKNFKKGDILCVQDNKYNKYISVGISLISSSEIEDIKKGIIIKNIHYVGDKYWEFSKMIEKI